jgi:hypothetical protein
MLRESVSRDLFWHPGDFWGNIYWVHIRISVEKKMKKEKKKKPNKESERKWISLLETMTNLRTMGKKLFFLCSSSFCTTQNILWQPSMQLGAIRRDLGNKRKAGRNGAWISLLRVWKYFPEFSTLEVKSENRKKLHKDNFLAHSILFQWRQESKKWILIIRFFYVKEFSLETAFSMNSV